MEQTVYTDKRSGRVVTITVAIDPMSTSYSEVTCDTCKGTGKGVYYTNEPCALCSGSGKIPEVHRWVDFVKVVDTG